MPTLVPIDDPGLGAAPAGPQLVPLDQPPSFAAQPTTAVGQTFTDPVTGQQHQIVQPGLTRQPGQWTQQDVENRMAVVRQPQAQLNLGSGPAGPTQAGPAEPPAQQFAQAHDPAFQAKVLANTPPDQRAAALRVLGQQQSLDVAPNQGFSPIYTEADAGQTGVGDILRNRADAALNAIGTGGKAAANQATFGGMNALDALLNKAQGGPGYWDSLAIAQAADAAAAAKHPEAWQKGTAVGQGAQGMLIPGMGAVKTALTGATLTGGQQLAEGKGLKSAGEAAVLATMLGLPLAGATGGLSKYAGPDRDVLAGAPTQTQLDDAATRGFNTYRNSGIEYAPVSTTQMQADIENGLRPNGYMRGASAAPTVNDFFNNLDRYHATGQPITAADMMSLRAGLNTASLGTPDSFLAGRAKQQLDNFIENAGPQHVMSGVDPSGPTQAFQDANANYAALKRSEALTTPTQRSELRATGHNREATTDIRNQYNSLITSDAFNQFNPQEQQAISAVNAGTPVGNTLSQLGKLSPLHGGIMGGAAAIELMQQLPEVARDPKVAIPAIAATVGGGMALNKLGSIGAGMTERQAALADALVRARSPLGGYANVAASARNIPRMAGPVQGLPNYAPAPPLVSAYQNQQGGF